MSSNASRGSAAPIVTISSTYALDSEAERLEAGGFDPEHYAIEGAIATAVTPKGVSYRFKAVRRSIGAESLVDLSLFHSIANRRPRAPFKVKHDPERATVVAYADPQWGKTDVRGGTAEGIARSARIREKAVATIKARRPSVIYLLDAGDGIEGFESSGGGALGTNDLGLPSQLNLYMIELWLWVEALARIAPLRVSVVPSNHAAWRAGPVKLSNNPMEDFGIMAHLAVERQAKAARIDATWEFPKDFTESITLNILGHGVGLTHGHQFAPNGAEKWWSGQAFGHGPLDAAEVLVSGHYHHFAEKNIAAGRWWLQCPTLDNGSTWYTLKSGIESDPGLLLFDITRSRGYDGNRTLIWDDFATAA